MNFPLVPFGGEVKDSQLNMTDDGCSSVIPLSVSFPYFGMNEKNLYVSDSDYQNTLQWHCSTNFSGFGPLKKNCIPLVILGCN